MNFIVASGPVIIERGKLLVIKDTKDNFYKLPGGTLEQGESLIGACIREVKEEINAKIEIIGSLNPLIIYKNPQTEQEITIVLIHYLARLKNKKGIRPLKSIREIKWLPIEMLKLGRYNIAPNIKFLIERGDIK